MTKASLYWKDKDHSGPSDGWEVRYRDSGGSQRTKRFPAYEARARLNAEEFADSITQLKRTGQIVTDRKLTLRQYATTWQTRQQKRHSTNTKRLVDNTLRIHLLPVLGDRTLTSVTRGDLEDWVAAYDGSASTLRFQHWAWVTSIFASAKAEGLIPQSPCAGVKLPSEEGETGVLFAPRSEVLLEIATHLPERWARLVPIGMQTGLRPGELLGLTPSALLDDGRLYVFQQAEGAKLKTKSSYRRLVIGDLTAKLIHEQAQEFGRTGPSDFIFPDRADGDLGYFTLKNSWTRARDLVSGAEGYGVHMLRHYHASKLFALKRSLLEVSHRLGHKTPAETLKTYLHVMPEDNETMTDTLNEEWH